MAIINRLAVWFRRLRGHRPVQASYVAKNAPRPNVVLDSQSGGAASAPVGGSWTALVEDCAALMVELDEMSPNLEPSALALSRHVRARLLEIMDRGGVSRIEGEKSFDVGRHQAWPPARFSQGTAIAETIEPGVAIGQRVLKRAKVRVRTMGAA